MLYEVITLMWSQQTHLSIAEYWRWWVVHLWVEGFFEVFARITSYNVCYTKLLRLLDSHIGTISEWKEGI